MSEPRPVVYDLVGEPHGGRFASLEGYRGLAAIGVLIFHTAARTGYSDPNRLGSHVVDNLGNFSVAVFFLLSGFLLYRPFCSAALEQVARPDCVRFLGRRLLRIYPAYWVVLIAWALTATSERIGAAHPFAVFLLVDPYVPPVPPFSGLDVAWTLSIEVGFYVFLPIVATVTGWWSKRIIRRERRLLLQFALLAAMYMTAMMFKFVAYEMGSTVWVTRWLPSYLDWFALGMLLALAVAWTDGGGRLPQAVQGLSNHVVVCYGLAAVAYASIVVMNGDLLGFAGRRTAAGAMTYAGLQGVAAFFVLLPAIVGQGDHMVLRMMRRPTVASLGVVSYGIYLWHQIVLAQMDSMLVLGEGALPLVTTAICAAAVTLPIATLSYRLIERPAMSLGASPPALSSMSRVRSVS